MSRKFINRKFFKLVVLPTIIPLICMSWVYLQISYLFQTSIVTTLDNIRTAFQGGQAPIFRYIMRYLIFSFLMQVLQMIGSWIVPYILPGIHLRVMKYIFAKIKRLTIHSHSESYLLAKEFIGSFLTTLEVILVSFFPKILELIMLIITCFSAHFISGILVIIWVIIILLINLYIMKKQINNDETLRNIRNRELLLLQENFNNFTINQCFSKATKWQDEKLDKLLYQDRKYYSSFFHLIGISKFLIGMANLLFYMILVVICHRSNYLDQTLRITLFASFWSATRTIWRFVSGMSSLIGLISNIKHGYRFFTLPEIDLGKKLPIIHSIKSISIQNPSIKIADRVINYNIDLHINKFGLYILKGPSGIGKSLLLKTLVKYYDHNQNTIYINSKDLHTLSSSQIHNSILYMPQQDLIYNASIRDNITFGQGKNINLKSFYHVSGISKIINNQEKYNENMMCGDQGKSLSGGERKILAFARTIYQTSTSSHKKLLILDEPLNYLDNYFTDKVIGQLLHLSKKNIIVCVSHRDMKILLENHVQYTQNTYIIKSYNISTT